MVFATLSYLIVFVAVASTITLFGHVKPPYSVGYFSVILTLIGLWIWVISPYVMLVPLIRKHRVNRDLSRRLLVATTVVCLMGAAVSVFWGFGTVTDWSHWLVILLPICQWTIVGFMSF